ncbi:ubiquinol oxidase subunit II [Permianibacter sp. IMCC34836]|uniref:cytochrome d ubiquinol oxidase subunit II n=1 Tax=Permianibacter fluminis TaxID=2738515 RepID=UPI001557A474|nr:cytochrome d ubiquinol oxidase subunit II [Permianibacter fluminis]NQD36170.1 ubiquinol oxidase subunit II [Permianibacter fluminis]
MDWSLLAYLLLGFAVLMYTVMDGFDLGIGIMLPWQRDAGLRDQMIQSIAPVWDGNETWLVLGGVLLLAAFPLAFATLLPALYVPVTLMLIGLIFRGVAFEFRFKTVRGRAAWDIAFAGGSALAAFAQGLMLATVIAGDLPSDGSVRLSIFSLFSAFGLMAGYGLLGLTWLHWRGDQALRRWAAKAARRTLIGVALFLALISLWTPLLHPAIAARWFSWPLLLALAPIPLTTGWLLWHIDRALLHGAARTPFLATVAVFLLGFAGLVISLFPWLVPGRLDLWQAAAHPGSMKVVLIGVLLLLPMILGYTFWSYRVFRGPIEAGYH